MSQASVQERTAQEEGGLLERLRAGDERAFEALVARCYPTMLAVALHHVRTRAVAEEASLFEQHVNFCDGCDWYLDQMRSTVRTVGRISEQDVPDETRERLLEAFREWKRP